MTLLILITLNYNLIDLISKIFFHDNFSDRYKNIDYFGPDYKY